MSDPTLRLFRRSPWRLRLPCHAMTCVAAFLWPLHAAHSQTNEASSADLKTSLQTPEQAVAEDWNWHVQNTDIVQYHPGFPASYSGPNSLSSADEVRETVSLDLYAGARLWHGAEAVVL